MKFKELLKKYRSIISYGIFGVLTTLVNILVYALMAHGINMTTVPSSVIAWIAAVAFAYVTNRKWVFYSEAKGFREITREVVWFFLCRLATGVIDWVFMYVTVDLLGCDDMWMKLIANIVVIILNYVASKVLVFRKGSADK